MSAYKKLNYNLYYKGNPNPSDTNNIVVDGTIDVNNKIKSVKSLSLNGNSLIEETPLEKTLIENDISGLFYTNRSLKRAPEIGSNAEFTTTLSSLIRVYKKFIRAWRPDEDICKTVCDIINYVAKEFPDWESINFPIFQLLCTEQERYLDIFDNQWSSCLTVWMGRNSSGLHILLNLSIPNMDIPQYESSYNLTENGEITPGTELTFTEA